MNVLNAVQVQPAYILHTRAFRETSLLLEIFSKDYGRVSLIANGVRGQGSKKSRHFSGLLQPFMPLLLSWKGRTTLLTLVEAEPYQLPPSLPHTLLPSAWYLNELIIRTLKPWDNYSSLFSTYHQTLSNLSKNLLVELRGFEKSLLKILGVLPQLNQDYITGETVDINSWYTFAVNSGVKRATLQERKTSRCFEGRLLLAIHNSEWEVPFCLSAAKWIFNLILEELLSYNPIRSRELL